jgi:hypothetical protein
MKVCNINNQEVLSDCFQVLIVGLLLTKKALAVGHFLLKSMLIT